MIREVLSALGWLGTFALLVLLMALVAGCTVRWIRLPDGPHGQHRYEVAIGWAGDAP